MSLDTDKQPDNKQPNNEQPAWQTWLKRFGIGAFFFFLAKGLVWVAIFMGLGKLICN